MSTAAKNSTARRVGVITLLVLVCLAVLISKADKLSLWHRGYLLLTTVDEKYGLEVGSPVFFSGVQIGSVVMIKEPTEESPGYKLRMAVEKRAFKHIPLDSPVRIESGGPDKPYLVDILPGRTFPEPDYPGKVKVLQEITPLEMKLRAAQDILQGLIDLSDAKSKEAQIDELKDQIRQLKKELDHTKQER